MCKKTVLITGASRGIGAALARRFAAAGYNLVLNCIHSEEMLAALAADLQTSYRVNCLCCVGDAGDYTFVEQMVTDAVNTFGGIDVLINNAGIADVRLLTDLSITDWNRLIASNLTSVFCTCRLVVPGMVHQKSGKIINISSVWGVVGASCEVAYSACKGGVNAFTRALAKELAPSGIQVNALACGVIDTEMNACFSPEERRALEDEIPAGRYGTPEEVAELAFCIASGHPYLTGQVIPLDGAFL